MLPLGTAHRDDVMRVLAACLACESVYVVREWPDGEINIIGQEGCSCGSTDFEPIDDSPDEPDESFDTG